MGRDCKKKEMVYQKSQFLLNYYYEIRTPTTKAVGSELVAKYQPTALVVGDANKKRLLILFRHPYYN